MASRRKAATATSLAALTTHAVLPRLSRAWCARVRQGNLTESGSSNVRVAKSLIDRCAAASARRQFCPKAYAIGRCMSGSPSWALMAPSVYSTIECTIDCGCTTASMRPGSMWNRWCASMISKALLSIVAESMVIFAPMCQFGCLRASAAFARAICSGAHVRKGPPEAVMSRRRTLSGSSPARHCAMAECSESMG